MPPFSTSSLLISHTLFLLTAHSVFHCARPTAHIATPPLGGSTGIAPVDSPSAPTEEMIRLAGGVGRVALARKEVSAAVMDDNGVEGGKGGSDGVSSPCLGSEMVSGRAWCQEGLT